MIALALLGALLAAVLPGLVGCDAGGAQQTAALASSHPAATLAERIPFGRSGRTTDLLCEIAPTPADAVPDWLAGTAPACACDQPTPSCRHVDLLNDRRRALLLAPGRSLRTRAVLDGETALRFAVAAVGRQPTWLDFRVTVRPLDGGAPHEWTRQARVADRWIDGEIDLAPFVAGSEVAIEIEVAPGPRAPEGSVAAIATPRLVAPTETGAGDPPNVIVYLIDTLRPDRTSTYGYHRKTTPHLDLLAQEAVVFDHAYSVASWTRPAVASLLTALAPGVHGIDVSRGLGREVVTLAERFRDAGWSTWAFVANVQVHAPELGFDQGFDRFVAFPGRAGGHVTRTSEVNRRLLSHLAAWGDEPFFLYVHAMDPHAPYDPPTGYLGRFGDPAYGGSIVPIRTNAVRLRQMQLSPEDLARVRDLYDEDIRFQDEMLGDLLRRLEESGLDRRTVVLVVADHGEELFERGDWEHGARLFEEQIRIPLVVRVPGVAGLAGRRIAEPVQITDVAPTLLRWFGLAPIEGAAGADLTPLLDPTAGARATNPDGGQGEHAAATREIYCEELRPDLGFDLSSLSESGWKLIRQTPAEGEPVDLLFDLTRDPGEQENLAEHEPERLAAVAGRLEALHAASSRSSATSSGSLPRAPDRPRRASRRARGDQRGARPSATCENGTTSACGVSISPSGSMKRQNTRPKARPSVSIQFGCPGSRCASTIRKLPSASSLVWARFRETGRFA
jgi:arylsulfatase A-like enzyme